MFWKPETGMLPCLSIRQPWAWLLVNGVKDVENREWTTAYRGPLLLHAGKAGDEWFFDRNEFLVRMWQARYGVIEGMPTDGAEFDRGGIVGIATLDRVVTSSPSEWFVGKYGFVLRDARPLPFIPYPGERKLFGVPPSVFGEKGVANAPTPEATKSCPSCGNEDAQLILDFDLLLPQLDSLGLPEN